jgi:hypothetical protein
MNKFGNGFSKNDYKQLSYGYYGRFSDARLLGDKKNIPLLGGMFQDCSVIYDKDKDNLKLSNSDQVYKCCLDNYDNIDKICFEKCNLYYSGDENKNCQDLCINLRNKWSESCENSKEYRGKLDPFTIEAINIKCWDKKNNIPDKDCIKLNKDLLISRCMQNCLPTGYTNCTDNCITSYNLVINPEEVSKLFDNILSNKYNKINSNENDNHKLNINNLYLPFLIGIILAIILISIKHYIIY